MAKKQKATKKSNGDLDVDKVYGWARKRGSFTTDDVVDEFGISAQRAAAYLAVMRIQKRLMPRTGVTKDGSSIWQVADVEQAIKEALG